MSLSACSMRNFLPDSAKESMSQFSAGESRRIPRYEQPIYVTEGEKSMAATQKKKQQEAPAPQVEARIDRMVDGDYKTKAYASVDHRRRICRSRPPCRLQTDKGRFISMPQESLQEKRRERCITTPSMPSPPRQGLRWWMRSTTLTSRGCRNAWSRARSDTAHGMDQQM